MKIKRFVAQDMRHAIQMVRENLGPDAVILSNKRVENGIELMAAIDFDQSEVKETAESPPKVVQTPPSKVSRPAPRAVHTAAPASTAPPAQERPVQSATDSEGGMEKMRQEMQELRRMMRAGLSEMSWSTMGDRQPERQELFRRLMALGLAPTLAKKILDGVEFSGDDVDIVWRKSLFQLAAELPVVNQDLFEQGGIVALLGPTGVGKTTTIAKLAARYALRHGPRHVALVTTDNFRIGARDQLQTYGRILNVPVRTATTPEEMRETLAELSGYRFILIDTAGMGQGGERFESQLAAVTDCDLPITRLLTLSATTDASAMHRVMHMYGKLPLDGCILTKLDEAGSLGGVLSAVVQNRMPVAYIADGQRVPEDLQMARAHPLVERAAELMDEYSQEYDSGYMAYAYGETMNYARV